MPVVVRGRVVEWLDGDGGWEVVDELAIKYTGQPYPRGANASSRSSLRRRSGSVSAEPSALGVDARS